MDVIFSDEKVRLGACVPKVTLFIGKNHIHLVLYSSTPFLGNLATHGQNRIRKQTFMFNRCFFGAEKMLTSKALDILAIINYLNYLIINYILLLFQRVISTPIFNIDTVATAEHSY